MKAANIQLEILEKTIDVELPSTPSTPRAEPMVRIPEPLNAVTQEEVSVTQNLDKWCSELRSRVLKGTDAVTYFFVGKEDMLCLGPFKDGLQGRAVVPEALRERLLTLFYHYHAVSGHAACKCW
jgi:putative methionine-R-sulfoxide reductase with GAF domain